MSQVEEQTRNFTKHLFIGAQYNSCSEKCTIIKRKTLEMETFFHFKLQTYNLTKKVLHRKNFPTAVSQNTSERLLLNLTKKICPISYSVDHLHSKASLLLSFIQNFKNPSAKLTFEAGLHWTISLFALFSSFAHLRYESIVGYLLRFHLFALHPSSIPWKHQRPVRFSDVFRG